MNLLTTYLKRTTAYLKKNGLSQTLSRIKTALREKNPHKYKLWIKNCEEVSPQETLSYTPLISVCMPVYNPEIRWLKKAVESVLSQTYPNFELVIADDCSTDPNVLKALREFTDSRIKIIEREKNGGISRATNTAIEAAKGEFTALLDNDDELNKNALYEAAKLINNHPNADLIYSDEDKIDEKGSRFEPFFKPDYSPHTLLSLNYISHFGIYRRDKVLELGGLNPALDGSQDYDLALRFSEATKEIYHIPKVLYHWRLLKTSTSTDTNAKNYAYTAAKSALEASIKRRNLPARVNEVKNSSFFDTEFYPPKNTLVSIIIPVKDKAEVTENCLKSIYAKTKDISFEIIIADNGSTQKETKALLEKYEKHENFRVIPLDMPFNFSKINNLAAKEARGDILLFLNNDTEVIAENWLSRLAGSAALPDVGCVGAKLLYPNGTIQHCGIVLGGGGLAGHIGIGAKQGEKGYFGRYIIPYNVSAATAACLAVKKSLFDAVGGFDESLAVAFNDVDFCLKVQKTGVYNLCIPAVTLYHYESLSRGNDTDPDKINRFNGEINYLKNKWGEKLLLNDPYYNKNLNLPLDLLFTPITDKKSRRLAEP